MDEQISADVLALLLALEWSGDGYAYDSQKVCPLCRGSKPLNDGDDAERGAGHSESCHLAQLITVIRRVRQ